MTDKPLKDLSEQSSAHKSVPKEKGEGRGRTKRKRGPAALPACMFLPARRCAAPVIAVVERVVNDSSAVAIVAALRPAGRGYPGSFILCPSFLPRIAGRTPWFLSVETGLDADRSASRRSTFLR